MEPIADLAALMPVVDALLKRGLMIALTPPGRGQIVSHNLYLEHELAELRAQYSGQVPRAPSAPGHARAPEPAAAGAPSDKLAALAAEVAELRAEVGRLRAQVGEPGSEAQGSAGLSRAGSTARQKEIFPRRQGRPATQ